MRTASQLSHGSRLRPKQGYDLSGRLARTASRAFRKLDKAIQSRVEVAVDRLAGNPKPGQATQLTTDPRTWPQSAALDQQAHAQGVSRAELIRELIDAGLGESGAADLDTDLAAIRDSFGALSGDDAAVGRGRDDRARRLERVASQ